MTTTTDNGVGAGYKPSSLEEFFSHNPVGEEERHKISGMADKVFRMDLPRGIDWRLMCKGEDVSDKIFEFFVQGYLTALVTGVLFGTVHTHNEKVLRVAGQVNDWLTYHEATGKIRTDLFPNNYWQTLPKLVRGEAS